MKKTQFIPIALLSVSAVANAQSASRPPNIILFLVDDMGWEDTSLPFWIQKTHYNEVYETPNMERLAKGGMMFTQAYASSISSPTRCSLIIGVRIIRTDESRNCLNSSASASMRTSIRRNCPEDRNSVFPLRELF